ncbi:hypothetical protein HanIR_Chr03g0110971 [Helianthus annuus]|nr:hypothetical protein HanIR_Chr03g0110971 [Helianthus annuus]
MMLWQERGNYPLKTPLLSRRSLVCFSEHLLQIPNFGLPVVCNGVFAASFRNLQMRIWAMGCMLVMAHGTTNIGPQ